MLLHPECQKRLQAELDAAGANNRTLCVDEIRKLPLWNAVWKESLRFSPAPLGEDGLISFDDSANVSLGIPHLNSQDDVWNGYFIPKGSAIYFNIGYVCVCRHPFDCSPMSQVHAKRQGGLGGKCRLVPS